MIAKGTRRSEASKETILLAVGVDIELLSRIKEYCLDTARNRERRSPASGM